MNYDRFDSPRIDNPINSINAYTQRDREEEIEHTNYTLLLWLLLTNKQTNETLQTCKFHKPEAIYL